MHEIDKKDFKKKIDEFKKEFNRPVCLYSNCIHCHYSEPVFSYSKNIFMNGWVHVCKKNKKEEDQYGCEYLI